MSTFTFEQLQADQRAGAALQSMINGQIPDAATAQVVEWILRRCAEDRVGADRFPQFVGHFEGWAIVRVGRTVKTKLGVAFEAGDVTLARFESAAERLDGGKATWVAFSFRNRCDTSIGTRSVEVLLEGKA